MSILPLKRELFASFRCLATVSTIVAFANSAATTLCTSPVAAQEWNYIQRISASDGEQYDHFGWGIALGDDVAMVAAVHGTPMMPPYPGTVYVYRKNDTGLWNETQILRPSTQQDNNYFGWSMELGDGRAIVSEVGDNIGVGAAYIFGEDSSGTWNELAVLRPAGIQPGPIDPYTYNFGYSVDMSGNTAIVGAIGDDTLGTNQGAAYIFREDANGAWNQIAKIHPAGGSSTWFGSSVAISGNTAVVSSSGNSAYIFRENDSGTWQQVAHLSSTAVPSSFGTDVDISGDTAVISDSFNVHFFRNDGQDNWSLSAKLPAPLYGSGDAVAIDGEWAIAGSFGRSTSVYRKNETTWSQYTTITRPANDPPADFSTFGAAIDIRGNTVIVSSLDNNSYAGAAYLFSTVPEPSCAAILGSALIATALLRKRKRATLL